jgi:NTE family protein
MSLPQAVKPSSNGSATRTPPQIALVLGGGGARAAYQAGVLATIARRYPDLRFSFLTGVSAGAINVSLLANHTGTLPEQAETLIELWRRLRIHNVFATEGLSLIYRALRIGCQLAFGSPPGVRKLNGMVDTDPLRRFLHEALDSRDGSLPGIARNIEAGRLKAVALAALSYGTGNTITFYQGDYQQLREKFRQSSVETALTIEHVMASAALPLFFPPIQINCDWYGDGGIRLVNPLAPALEMGADRIMAISNHYLGEDPTQTPVNLPPSPATVLAAMYNAVFLDQLDQDVLEMRMINKLVRELPEEKRYGMRNVELLVIRPSQDIGAIAYQLRHELPTTLNYLMGRFGTDEIRSQDFLSTVMFHAKFVEQLIELGQRDAEALAPRLQEFLALK